MYLFTEDKYQKSSSQNPEFLTEKRLSILWMFFQNSYKTSRSPAAWASLWGITKL